QRTCLRGRDDLSARIAARVVALADGSQPPGERRSARPVRWFRVVADAEAASGAGLVRIGADGAGLLAGGARTARRQSARSRNHQPDGTTAESDLGLPGITGDGNAVGLHAGGGRLHRRGASLAIL